MSYNGIKEPEIIYLGRPGKRLVCALNGVEPSTVEMVRNLTNTDTLSFEVDKYVNGEPSNGYDLIDVQMLLYIEKTWFKIIEVPVEDNDGNRIYKTVSAESLEIELQQYQLVGLRVNNGTPDSYDVMYRKEHELATYPSVKFHDPETPDLSLMHIILKHAEVKDWTIGYIDDVTLSSTENALGKRNLLKDEVGCFDVDSQDVYSFLTKDVSQAFSCIFLFNTEKKTINAYGEDTLGKFTNLIIGFQNLQNQLTIETDRPLYTQFNVQGDEELGIEFVNFGTSLIENLSYFLNEKYLPKDLIEKYKAWFDYRESRRKEYKEVSIQYRKWLTTVSELQYRVPTDAVENRWDSMSEEDLKHALDDYIALVTGLEALYVDEENNFDIEALKASVDWDMYQQVVQYIIPSIKAAMQNKGMDTSKYGFGNKFTNVNPVITVDWINTTGAPLSTIDLYGSEPCKGATRAIQFEGESGIKQTVVALEVGEKYTLSAYVKCLGQAGEVRLAYKHTQTDEDPIIATTGHLQPDKWMRVSTPITFDYAACEIHFLIGLGEYQIAGMQLEKGELHDFGFYAGNVTSSSYDPYENNWELFGTIELAAKLKVYENSLSRLVESGYDKVDSQYEGQEWEYHVKMHQQYLDYQALYDACKKALDERKAELEAAQKELENYGNKQDKITHDVEKENFGQVQTQFLGFTDRELSLLNTLYSTSDYVNKNIVATSILTEEEYVEQQAKLYDEAVDQLYLECHPQYTYTDTAENLYALPEFKDYHEDLTVGNFVYIGLDEDTFVKLRVTSLTYNPCIWDVDLTIEFSSMLAYEGKRSDWINLLDTAISSSTNQISGLSYGGTDITTYTITADVIKSLLGNPAFGNAIGTGAAGAINGQINYLVTKTIKTESIQTEIINAVQGNFDRIFTDYIEAGVGSFDKIVTDFLMAGKIITDDISSATGNFTNYLTGVKIMGDLIEANTLVADKIVLRGSDKSVVYSLNQLGDITIEEIDNGKVDAEEYLLDAGKTIIASTITSREIHVNDLWVNGIAKMLNAEIGTALIKDLTAITSHLGSWYFEGSTITGTYDSLITGGVLQSANYKTQDGVVTDGCRIDLNNFTINSPNFKIDALGNITAKGTFVIGEGSTVPSSTVVNEKGESLEEILNTVGGKIDLHADSMVFVEEGSIITPGSITVTAVCSNTSVSKWYIDGVEDSSYTSPDGQSVTIPSALIMLKDTIQIKAENQDGTIFDIVTLYKLKAGSPSITVVLRSSNGQMWPDDTLITNTTITATVYKGSEAIHPKSYQWQVRKDNSNVWTTVPNTTRTYTMSLSDFQDRQTVRCLVEV